MKKSKTPNALPPTVISLGEVFKNASITRKGAESISHIDCLTIGDRSSNKREGKKAGHYPYHLIDIWHKDDSGEEHVLVRSRDLRINQKRLRSLMRQTTRKVADYLFAMRND